MLGIQYHVQSGSNAGLADGPKCGPLCTSENLRYGAAADVTLTSDGKQFLRAHDGRIGCDGSDGSTGSLYTQYEADTSSPDEGAIGVCDVLVGSDNKPVYPSTTVAVLDKYGQSVAVLTVPIT